MEMGIYESPASESYFKSLPGVSSRERQWDGEGAGDSQALPSVKNQGRGKNQQRRFEVGGKPSVEFWEAEMIGGESVSRRREAESLCPAVLGG